MPKSGNNDIPVNKGFAERHVLDLSLPKLRELEDECRGISPLDQARMNLEQGKWDRRRYPTDPNIADSFGDAARDFIGIDQVGVGIKIEFMGDTVTKVTAGAKAAGLLGGTIEKDFTRNGKLVRDLEIAGIHRSNSLFYYPDNPADNLPTDGADIEAAKERAKMVEKMWQPITENDPNTVCAAIPTARPGRNR